jgi:pimeloyl-ACP methyl ester carboxylesterase
MTTSEGNPMATFVLVHGAWFGGWCWQKVIPLLEGAGHEVHAPTHTGLAERASELSPEVGLDTHIQDVVGLLEQRDLHGVILVGHSYGGMVITGVVDQVPERIAHLIYLDTFVPRDGESMVSISRIVVWILRKQTRGDGWRVDSRGDYGVTTEPDRSWVLSKVTPQSLKTFEQPLHLKNPGIVSTKLRTHIDCTGRGRFWLRSLMRRILARRALPPTQAGWRLRQLPTSHCAMITMPQGLADLLLDVV